MASQLRVNLLKDKQQNYKMNNVKDCAANLVGYVGIGAYLANAEIILTITLLLTGIILNIVRIRAHRKDKDQE